MQGDQIKIIWTFSILHVDKIMQDRPGRVTLHDYLLSRMTRLFSVTLVTFILFSCAEKEKLFSIHRGGELGIEFQNTIETNDTLNALTFEYIYNGSGVGIGDFNNDGLEDIFFGGNQVSSRLYLNAGNLSFNDVTKPSGVATDRWITGVSIVDINGDGWDDIYLSVAGKTSSDNRRNLLCRQRWICCL